MMMTPVIHDAPHDDEGLVLARRRLRLRRLRFEFNIVVEVEVAVAQYFRWDSVYIFRVPS